MNFLKFFLAIAIGALCTGAALSVSIYFLSLYNRESSTLMSFGNMEYILAIVGAVLGAIIGGISGAIIAGFQMGLFPAIFFGVIFYILVGTVLHYIAVNPLPNEGVKYMWIALIIDGVVSSMIISLINTNGRSTELQ